MMMYQQHFGFSGFPFSIAPDPSVLYLSQVHSQALVSLQYGVQREGGFLLFTGEVGTGKTTLTKLFLQQLPDTFKIAYILNPRLNEVDLLLSIAEELHIEPSAQQHNIRDLIKLLNQALLAEHAQGKQVLVVIEEAQNLSPELLEMLRLLTNLETDTNKLLSILLVGQPELLEMINNRQMRQLDQRIIARYHIQPLSFSEVRRYLDYRLQQVGGHGRQISFLARLVIQRYSQGVPRKINLLTDAALLMAFRRQKSRVGWRHVLRATKVVNFQQSSKRFWIALMAIIIAAAIGLSYLAPLPSTIADVVEKLSFQWDTKTVAEKQHSQIGNSTTANEGAELRAVDQQNTAIQLSARSTDAFSATKAINDTVGNDGVESENEEKTVSQSTENNIVSKSIVTESDVSARNLITDVEVSRAGDDHLSLVPLQRLLSLWRLPFDGHIDWVRYCSETNADLACYQNSQVSIDDLKRFNMPAMLTWLDSEGQASTIVLASIRGQLISYYQSSGIKASSTKGSGLITVSMEEFSQRWLGDVRLLWPRPTGFQQTLYPDEQNSQLMDWVQTALIDRGVMTERFITGGFYNVLLVDFVKQFQRSQGLEADAVLGIRTLLAMMPKERLVDVPQLSTDL